MRKMKTEYVYLAVVVTAILIGFFIITRQNLTPKTGFQKIIERTISRSLQARCQPKVPVYSVDDVYTYSKGWSKQDDPGFVRYIRQHWLHGPSKRKTTLSRGDHSQYGEYKMVDKLLNHKTNGFFFECGALDGEWLSSSAAFETVRNWTGLLVEANPYTYHQLLSKHRNAYSMNNCLSANSKNETEIVSFLPAGPIGGVKDAIKEGNLEGALKHNKGKGEVPVQCFPVYSMLLAVGQTKVDFFSLDIEGLELEVLRTMPMDKLDIDVFVIEYNIHDAEKQAKKLQAIRDFFTMIGGYKDLGVHEKNIVFQKVR